MIIDTQDVKSEVVNNFENFTFILPNKIKNPILTIEKLINLPANGSMEILTKNKPTKGKYILIQSDVYRIGIVKFIQNKIFYFFILKFPSLSNLYFIYYFNA